MDTNEFLHPDIKVHVLPGGHAPERKTDGAIGYDARIRAVVSDREMDTANPILRKTLFDFEAWPDDPSISGHVVSKVRQNGHELIYRIDPGQSVMLGLGFFTAMPFPMFYWVAPRSGFASKHKITITNAPGTIDPDYRGEAGALIHNRGEDPFDLSRSMRIVQVIFQWALIPQIEFVDHPEKLGETTRGTGGFGSTGVS